MSENQNFAVAIDGPAASGKSTVARRLAERLGLIMINTGAMYRAIAWATLQQRVDPADTEAVLEMLDRLVVSCGVKDGTSTILINRSTSG